MATHSVVSMPTSILDIDDEFRELLHLEETETAYLTHSVAGVIISHPKSETKYVWQLLGGILAGASDPNEALEREKQEELADEARMSGREL